MPKLKPILFLGIAGGVVAAIRKRASKEQSQQPAGDRDATPRYAAPAEAGAQPPAESGGAPSDEPQTTRVHSVAIDEDPSLDATRAHDLPKDVAMPDVSDDDPAVQDAEAAAAADARAIGRNADENQP
jgi:hypothetical protein